MSRLVVVELRRLAARRLVRLLTAALLAGIVVILAVNAVQSNRDLAGAHARAEQQVRQVRVSDADIQWCEADATANNIPPAEAHCRPQAADFYRDPQFPFAERARQFAAAGVGLGIAWALLVAASGIGAEWSAGTFAGLLTWRPQRWRVLAAKLAAVTLTGAVVTAVATALLVAGAWLVAATRGTLAGPVAHAARLAAGTGGRGVAAAALLALLAGALAVLVRSTAGVLGLVALYAVGVENAVRALRPGWARWELIPNAVALVNGSLQLPVGSESRPSPGAGEMITARLVTVHARAAAVYLVVLAAVAVVAAGVLLARRDLT